MAKVHPKAKENIDAYIEKQDPSIGKNLIELRQFILSLHDGIEEDWKWGAPSFAYKGLICWMVSFKEFIGLNFYKGSLIEDYNGLYESKGIDDKNNRLIYFPHGSKPDLDAIRPYIIEAIRLNENNIKPKAIRKELKLPDYFVEALNANPVAKKKYESLTYSKKKDYVDWLSSAKREETRNKRLEQAMSYIENDIDRHAKYR